MWNLLDFLMLSKIQSYEIIKQSILYNGLGYVHPTMIIKIIISLSSYYRDVGLSYLLLFLHFLRIFIISNAKEIQKFYGDKGLCHCLIWFNLMTVFNVANSCLYSQRNVFSGWDVLLPKCNLHVIERMHAECVARREKKV